MPTNIQTLLKDLRAALTVYVKADHHLRIDQFWSYDFPTEALRNNKFRDQFVLYMSFQYKSYDAFKAMAIAQIGFVDLNNSYKYFDKTKVN